MTYSFININLSITKIYKFDRKKNRKLLTIRRMHLPTADIKYLHLLRIDGCRGFLQMVLKMRLATISINIYLKRDSDDWVLKLVVNHENKEKYSVTKQAR